MAAPHTRLAPFKSRITRLTAWTLFLLTTVIMITGVLVAPQPHSKAHAQVQTNASTPTIDKVEKTLQAGTQTPAKHVDSINTQGHTSPLQSPPQSPSALAPSPARNQLTFTIAPDAKATTLIEQPSHEAIWSDDTPKFSGRARPGYRVKVTVDGKKIGLVDVTQDGTWSLVPKKALKRGEHLVKAELMPPAPKVAVKKMRKIGQGAPSSVLERSISFLGILLLIGVAFLMSNNKKAINWRLVGVGVLLQLIFALLIFYFPPGKFVFEVATKVVDKLLSFTQQGSSFLFKSFATNSWEPGLINIAFGVLPTIIFFSSLMTVAYHIGLMQKIVNVFAVVMQRFMGTSGAESLSAAANIFVGQTEAPLVIKPYVDNMTNSELMTVMTGGFATVAGGVLAIYVGILKPSFPDIAGHLLAASVMSAPAALVIGKIIYPETKTPETAYDKDQKNTTHKELEKEDVNVIDAAARGASEGLKLALNVAAMLLAFLALIAMLNYIIGLPSLFYNKSVLTRLVQDAIAAKTIVPAMCMEQVADDKVITCIQAVGGESVFYMPVITLQHILGYVFWPFAFAMGVPAADCIYIGQLLGEKIILNELVAYSSLQTMLMDPAINLSDRSVVIATYALCGFANIGSIGIQLGGIGGIAPSRKGDLAKIAFRAMIAGTLAALMTATIAGILV